MQYPPSHGHLWRSVAPVAVVMRFSSNGNPMGNRRMMPIRGNEKSAPSNIHFPALGDRLVFGISFRNKVAIAAAWTFGFISWQRMKNLISSPSTIQSTEVPNFVISVRANSCTSSGRIVRSCVRLVEILCISGTMLLLFQIQSFV